MILLEHGTEYPEKKLSVRLNPEVLSAALYSMFTRCSQSEV